MRYTYFSNNYGEWNILAMILSLLGILLFFNGGLSSTNLWVIFYSISFIVNLIFIILINYFRIQRKKKIKYKILNV